jgi:HAD superfamily hydrolase (TIGR01509 family)
VGDYLRRTAKWLGLFDHLCFSGELKVAKPDPAIFHVCLKALGVPAPQTLFIDDIEANIAAARSVGIRGIVFHSAQDLEVDLKPYGLAQSLAEARTLAG